MANQLYGYNYSSYGGGTAANISSSGKYSSRSVADSYLSSDPSFSRYLSSSDPLSSYNRIPGVSVGSPSTPHHLTSHPSWSGPPGVDSVVGPASAVTDLYSSFKRTGSDAFDHQTIMGAHNFIGQTEGLFPTNPLAKRPRLWSSINLPTYPQRPGEKDCAHYMLTRTCKFGDSCKFDHPIWVPEGGIPDWKEVPLISSGEYLPERPGEPDCPYFLKTQRCKYGDRCKFNHPKDSIVSGFSESNEVSTLPERPSEPPCAFYMKTGKCKFGVACKFHHPKDLKILSAGQENNTLSETGLDSSETAGDLKISRPLFTPALLHNSKGLPIRLGEVDCPFYLKTGSCKYGVTCRYNHPERNTINPPAAAVPTPGAQQLNSGAVPASTLLQTFDPRMSHTSFQLGLGAAMYPQRPGEIECDFYMKTGECKFGQRCRFHHPFDRSATLPTVKDAQQQNVKLTLAGLPRREGATRCPYYMKTGMCKYGASCKFDHPPPGEVMALATSQGTSASSGGLEIEDEKQA